MSVSIEKDGRIALVRFDRGDAINALSHALMGELTEAARSFEDDHETAVVILTGAQAIFTAGMDLKDPAVSGMRDLPLSERTRAADTGARMARAWGDLEPVTIAAIEGVCMGGGVVLAAMCDFRIGTEGNRFATPEVRRGLNMAWNSIPRLVSLVGPQVTRRMVIAGHELSGEEAFADGFVDALAEAGGSLDLARAWAEDMVADCPPVQLRMVKRQIANAAHGFDHALSALDRDQFLLALGSADAAEAASAFKEKRKPRYSGG